MACKVKICMFDPAGDINEDEFIAGFVDVDSNPEWVIIKHVDVLRNGVMKIRKDSTLHSITTIPVQSDKSAVHA